MLQQEVVMVVNSAFKLLSPSFSSLHVTCLSRSSRRSEECVHKCLSYVSLFMYTEHTLNKRSRLYPAPKGVEHRERSTDARMNGRNTHNKKTHMSPSFPSLRTVSPPPNNTKTCMHVVYSIFCEVSRSTYSRPCLFHRRHAKST